MSQAHSDPMEFIWDNIPKTNGIVVYFPGDLAYLYNNGFVDTRHFEYEEWKAAFSDCLQPDGNYHVTKEKFLSLRPFRYSDRVQEPFNPFKVREGLWTDDDLKKLFEKSIKPSSGILEEVYWNSIKALKKQGFEKDGCLLVNESVKKQLNYLIERFPSPRRKLEKEVLKLKKEKETHVLAVAKNRDASQFFEGQLSSEEMKTKLKNLETRKAATTPAGKNIPSVNLKSLKKPPRKISG